MVEVIALVGAVVAGLAVVAWRGTEEEVLAAREDSWEAAGFVHTEEGWVRGPVRAVETEQGWHLVADVPAGISMGVPGPVHVATGVALWVDEPAQRAQFDSRGLRFARTLDEAATTIADGRLRVRVAKGHVVDLANAIDGFLRAVQPAPTPEELLAKALRDDELARAAAETLVDVAPDLLPTLRDQGSGVPRLLAALALGDWEVVIPMRRGPKIPPSLQDRADAAFLEAIPGLTAEQALTMSDADPGLQAEVVLHHRCWERLPDASLRNLAPERRRRVLGGLYADGHTVRSLSLALQTDPWWTMQWVDAEPTPEALAPFRAIAEQPGASVEQRSVAASFLETWGDRSDLERMAHLQLPGIEQRQKRLMERLGGVPGALSIAERSTGSLSEPEEGR